MKSSKAYRSSWAAAMFAFSLVPAANVDAFGRKGSEATAQERMDARRARIEAEVGQAQARTDAQVVEALAAGKAIVVTGTINLDARFKDPSPEQLHSREFNYDKSAMTIWIGPASSSIEVGNPLNASQRREYAGNLRGADGRMLHTPLEPQYFSGEGQTLYQVFIVEPGAYRLAGSRAALRKTRMPDGIGQRDSAVPSHIGSLTLSGKAFTEYARVKEWENAQYRQESVEYTFCQAVRVVNGQCASYGTATQPVTRLAKAAGYYENAKITNEGGLDTIVALDRTFARFTVDPGQVALVDGFFADYPNVEFDPATCAWSATDTVKCPIQAFSMTRLEVSLAEFQQALKASPRAAEIYPRLTELLSKAKPLSVEVTASRQSHTVRAGPTYRLGGGK